MNKNEIRKSAFQKLEEYIKCEIKLLADGKLSLFYFGFEPVEGYFSKDELNELEYLTKQLKDPNKKRQAVIQFCNIYGIVLPYPLLIC